MNDSGCYSRQTGGPHIRLRRFTYLVIWMSILIFLPSVATSAGAYSAITTGNHPSLLLNADDIPAIKSRLGHKPYESWWASAIQVAKAKPVDRGKVEDNQVEYAKRARHAAFCYLITGDEAFATIALERLEHLPKMIPEEMDGKSHLKLAQTGRDFAEAYDILLPWLNEKFPEARIALAEKLRYIGWELREFGPNWYRYHKNNHGIRQFSGLGLVAMALRDDPEYSDEASDWLDYAVENLPIHLRHQICDPVEGGFAEGFSYLFYSGAIMWDFFYALKNVTGKDFWAEPDIRALHIYAARAQMPTGCWPNFDDASYGYFPAQIFCDAYPDDAGLFVDRYQARVKAWNDGYGELRNDGRRIGFNDDYILSMIHYDDSIVPTPPVYPELEVLEKAGDAVFRYGEGPEAIYLNMRIEGKRAAFNAGGHDQPDPLAISLQAFGENLLLDSGYIKWEERDKVATSDNHNMITVDGKGPIAPIKDIPLEGFVDVIWYHSLGPRIIARTNYRGSKIERNVILDPPDGFLVTDNVESEIEREFTLNLHGNAGEGAGGMFSFDESTSTARWERDNAGIAIYITAPPDAEFTIDKDEHSFAYGEFNTHSVVRVTASGKKMLFLFYIHVYEKARDGQAVPGP